MVDKAFKICILGLGNLMHQDDAVGMLTLYRLKDDPRLPSEVEVIEGGILGLDLLHVLHGISHVLVLDAVDIGAIPGTLLRFAMEDLWKLPIAKSVHLLGLSDLVNVLRLLDAPPVEIVLLGVQPESTDWGTELNSVVEAAQGNLVEAALKQIAQWQDEDASKMYSAPPVAFA